MRFEWISRGQPTVSPVYLVTSSVSVASSTLTSQLDSLDESTGPPEQLPVETGPQAFVSRITDAVSSMRDTVTMIRGNVATLAMKAATGTEVARNVVSSCSAVIQKGKEIKAQCDAQPGGALNNLVSIGAQSFSERMIADVYLREIRDNARAMVATATEQRTAFTQQLDQELLGIYTARDGEDLRDVSRLYYGSPFQWRDLLSFNNLDSPALVANQLVLVPKITGVSDQGRGA